MTLCAYRRRRQILTLAVCFDFMVVRIYHGCVYTLMTFNWLFVPLSVFSLLKRFYPKPFLSQFTNVVRIQQQKQPSLFIFALFVLVFSDLQNCYVLLPASWSNHSFSISYIFKFFIKSMNFWIVRECWEVGGYYHIWLNIWWTHQTCILLNLVSFKSWIFYTLFSFGAFFPYWLFFIWSF